MIQKDRNLSKNKVFYNDQWIDKEHFRVMLYDINRNSKLVKTIEDYNKLIESKEWFEYKDIPVLVEVSERKVLKIRKSKDGIGEH